MTAFAILVAILILVFVVWMMSRPTAGERSGPDNNWQNEDYLSREADGTWAEGSTHSKTEPGDSTGMFIP